MAMNGGGSTYKSADGIWHAAIDIEPDRATGRRRRLTAQGKTKAVANARLRMKLDAYVRKGFTPNSPSPRLMDWLETWYHERAEANLRPNSRRSYENAIVRLNKIAGARRINSLGHKDMTAIQDGLKCYSPKTATITWSVLKNALEAARDENLIQRNPAKMVRTVSGRRRPMKVLSPAQAAELIKAEPDLMWRLNWLFAFTTRLRQGERLGLTMDELTTLNGRRALVIDHQLQRIPDPRKADWPLGEDVTDLGGGDKRAADDGELRFVTQDEALHGRGLLSWCLSRCLMVPKIRATRRENIDRRQVRGIPSGCFLEVVGRDGRVERCDGRRQAIGSVRAPFRIGSLYHRLCRHPRESSDKRAKPHDSAVFWHPPCVRYTCENLSADLWVPRRETPTQLQRFWPVYSPHPRKRAPRTAKYTPGTVSNTRRCSYNFSILLIYALISDSKSVNPISRTMASQYPDRSFRKSRTRERTRCRNS